MREVPVYLIVGFLDSGKTRFINGVLEEGFAQGERTVLLCCEEGEEEYEKAALDGVTVVSVESEGELTAEYLRALEKTYRPTQVLVEFNGMWDLEAFCTGEMPENWTIYQMMCTVEASTFSLYAKNMGKLMMEKLRGADLIVFNRCTDELKAELRRRNLRMVNRRAEIYLEMPDGASEDYKDGTVPAFDLSRGEIHIPDEDFGVFYVELMDNLEPYLDKLVHFKGLVCQDKRFGQFYTVGRHAMVCCAEDITYLALPCAGEGKNTLKTRDWVEITARVERCRWKLYEGESGPLLRVERAVPCERPEPEVVQF